MKIEKLELVSAERNWESADIRDKINELVQAINTLTAPKPPQEESLTINLVEPYVPKGGIRDYEFVVTPTVHIPDADEIRADERKKLYKALKERDSKMYGYYKSVFLDWFEGGYPAEWDEPFTNQTEDQERILDKIDIFN